MNQSNALSGCSNEISDVVQLHLQYVVSFSSLCNWLRFLGKHLNWATGVSLIVPLEVRNEAELEQVAILAKRLLLGQTTLQNEFPKYRYGKTDWFREQGANQ